MHEYCRNDRQSAGMARHPSRGTICKGGWPSSCDILATAADACDANLLVMGSYSTGPLRQEIFGGCTRSMLNEAAIPEFLVH